MHNSAKLFTSIGHYKILDPIGAGVIGEVYRARDTRLGRTVAIKIIRPDLLSSDERREQFLREARAALTLSHPNIATLFEVGESEGQLFLVSEHVSGEPLAAVTSGRPLGPKRAIDLVAQLADGLAEAHAHEIIHRDIRPDNIIITPKGHAKILGFGLAMFTGIGSSCELASTRTTEGRFPGTVAYLSPEQALGDPVDYRADIFSLGIVLFEMLTGQLPFSGPDGTATAFRIVQASPAKPSLLNPGIPKDLDAIVERALARNRKWRYQSSTAMATELRAVGRTISGAPLATTPPLAQAPTKARGGLMRKLVTRSVATLAIVGACLLWRAELRRLYREWIGPSITPVIAVVPLQLEGTDRSRIYFADGLTEDLVTRLGQTPGVKVLGRSAIRSFRGKAPRDVARALGAAVVLTGSVWPQDEQLRVMVELLDPTDQTRLWSGRYTKPLANVFGAQAEIADDVARELRVRLNPSGARARTGSRLVNANAYDLYLRGRNAVVRGDLMRAIGFYEQAVSADSTLAEAYAGLAEALHLDGRILSNPPSSDLEERIRRAAEQASSLDPDLPQAQLAMGLAAPTLETALMHLRRSIEIDPSYSQGFYQIGDQIAELEPGLAVEFYRKSLALDPRTEIDIVNVAVSYKLLGGAGEADSEILISRAASPDRPPWNGALGVIRFYENRYDEAAGLLTAAHITQGPPILFLTAARALDAAGRRDQALRVLVPATTRYPYFCEGRALLAGFRHRAGERAAARRIVTEIFESADGSNAPSSIYSCAAMAAASMADSAGAAAWLRRVANNEQAMQHWTRMTNGVSPGLAFSRRWYPWNQVGGAEPVAAASVEIESVYTRLRKVTERILTGLP